MFIDLAGHSKNRKQQFLEEMESCIPWEFLEEILGLINIYRVLLLQKLLKKRDKNLNFYLSFFKN